MNPEIEAICTELRVDDRVRSAIVRACLSYASNGRHDDAARMCAAIRKLDTDTSAKMKAAIDRAKALRDAQR